MFFERGQPLGMQLLRHASTVGFRDVLRLRNISRSFCGNCWSSFVNLPFIAASRQGLEDRFARRAQLKAPMLVVASRRSRPPRLRPALKVF